MFNADHWYDPTLDVHVPELLTINDQVRAYLNDALSVTDPVKLAAARKGVAAGEATMRRADFNDRFIDGPGGPLRLRYKSPQSPSAVLLDMHGGAFCMGSPDQHDPLNERYVTEANMAVVSVDYRLAPEDPYPAAPDDCEAAAVWLVENAKREFGTDRIVVTGTSAGGNLAAVTLLRLRDRHDALGQVIGANLVYGGYDMSGTPSQIDQDKVSFRVVYLPTTAPADRKVPDISPLYADLTGMPPALFTVGTNDYLYDDNLFMYMRWRAAGSTATLAIYPEAMHGFTAMPSAMGAEATNRMIAWTAALASS
jgi:acetyl esterase